MATLNTLRTKFGIVLSVIIAFALLAFILSLRTEMGFSGNNPKVGEIAGDKISYMEYYDEYETVKSRNGGEAYDDNAEDRLSSAAWQSLITKHALRPGFERMGLVVTEAEHKSMLSGEHMSGVYYQAFADPATGEYDVAAIAEFLNQAAGNPQAMEMWNFIDTQAQLDREMAKFAGLVKGGTYVNSLEVANGVSYANNTFSGKVASVKYTSVPDSLFSVSSGEMKKYYNEHKNMFKQQPSRTLSYVLFEVDPTQEDMAAIEAEVRGVAEKFEAAEDVKAFARQNRGTIAGNYVSGEQLSSAESETLMAGRMYGPVLENDTWKIARVADVKTVPDSLGLRHIVLSYTDEKLADSLHVALKGGGDFAAAAREYSLANTGVNGGELGVVPFSALPADFVDALASAKRGDVVKVATGNTIQILEVYRADKASRHVNVARIEYPVEASSATRRAVHGKASAFATAANGSVEKFNAAASEAAVTPRVAAVSNSERSVRGLERSHEIVRWAYGADKGDVSEIFKIGKDYVVAILTDIDNNEFKTLASVETQVRNAVLRDKKFAHIVAGITGSDVESVAEGFGTEVAEFSNLSHNAYFIPGVGFEPRLVGAITATSETGALSTPVQGATGVYLFVVDEINNSEKQTEDAERVRLQATAENMAQQAAVFAVQELADVKDLRSRYF